jgi:alpha-mannosidase
VERHRPALFARIRQAMRASRWEPLNGPWVETDAMLIGTPSLLRQFQDGQAYSRARFPEWEHGLAWLPDSFGFAAGLPAVAAATGVRWFCTHKLAWNATTPFPHRLFRWRSRCGAEVLALMTAPIGTSADPVAIERYRLDWQAASGVADALWLPGVGDHGGGPTAEMLEQLALWDAQPVTAPQRHGTLRDYLQWLEPLRPHLPVWRDELYLELHRGCATSRPDQKRHNRTLERMLREADFAAALLWVDGRPGATPSVDWSALLFQQFHDILPGTSVPEVFEQAEPQWRQARRRARRQRDAALAAWCSGLTGEPSGATAGADQIWWLAALQPLPAAALTLRLPRGGWWRGGQPLPVQAAPNGGSWVQVPAAAGAWLQSLRRVHGGEAPPECPAAVTNPVRLERLDGDGGPRQHTGRWRLGNGLVFAQLGPGGLEQLWGADHQPQLSAPLEWRRWRDRGEFWDAWDLAADYREHPLPLEWTRRPEVAEAGPLCCRIVWRGRCGRSPLRLDLQLLAGSPWLELTLRVDWRQRHEVLRLELPLQQAAVRWAADTSGGVIERPAVAVTAREASRWEVPAISWMASQTARGGLAVLLDGPQGVSCSADRLGVSLLRAPTWPDPGADNGPQRLRLALMPCVDGWRRSGVAAAAVRFREPLWRWPGPSALARQDVLQLGSPDLQLVGLRPDPEPGVVRLTASNLSPCRRVLNLGRHWRVVERVDGLGHPRLDGADLQGGDCLVLPWQLASWRIRRS